METLMPAIKKESYHLSNRRKKKLTSLPFWLLTSHLFSNSTKSIRDSGNDVSVYTFPRNLLIMKKPNTTSTFQTKHVFKNSTKNTSILFTTLKWITVYES